MTRSLEATLATTAEQVEQRIAMGDEVRSPRTVDHVAFFPRGRAAAAQQALRAAGFDVTSTRPRLLRTAVEFCRVDAVDARSAASFTREVVTLVAEYGGDYDGWGGLVVTAEEAGA